MVRNLIKHGHRAVVFDVAREPVEALVAEGHAEKAGSPAEVAERCDTLVSMLPSSPHVASVYEGADGVCAGIAIGKNTLCIESSTIEPAMAQQVAKAVHAKGGRMVDAPVSGGVGGAEGGTLTFMVGGDHLEAARPFLEQMGKNIVHCGGSGTGQVAKICNNLVLAISMCGVSEAMNLGVQLGMDPAIIASIMNSSSGRCWSSDTYNPVPGVMPNVPASKGYKGGFAVDLMSKDVSLAIAAAHAIKVPLPLGAASQQLYNTMSSQGMGRFDFSSVYAFLSNSRPSDRK